MTQNTNLVDLSNVGVSVWLDDLSRERIQSGNLTDLIETRSVVGVTTNPTIFQLALSNGDTYDNEVRELASRGAAVEELIRTITTDDVRAACDVFAPIYESSGGKDGRVSIEVDPFLAFDTDKTVAQAIELYKIVDRPNVLIKIPATLPGLPAITQVIAEGISVNVTLIFSLERYRAVINAYLTGLERALEQGRDLSKTHSVASFFVSRVDSEVDARLEQIGTEQALALKGRAGLANARLAYQVFQEAFSSERWKLLAEAGAVVQRPLWASTGTKDPAYPDTMYVDGLVAPDTVNTLPEKTLEAAADHAEVTGDTITGTYDDSERVLNELEQLGISYQEVVEKLEREGVDKFVASWEELLETVTANLHD